VEPKRLGRQAGALDSQGKRHCLAVVGAADAEPQQQPLRLLEGFGKLGKPTRALRRGTPTNSFNHTQLSGCEAALRCGFLPIERRFVRSGAEFVSLFSTMRVIDVLLGPVFDSGFDPMDTTPTDGNSPDYSDQPPVLIVASSDAAMTRALRTVEASGLRIGDKVPVESARDRIERQVAATAVWVELDKDSGEPMDELLARVNRDVADGRYGAVVSAPAALLDPLMSSLDERAIELIVDADDPERAAALAIATARAGMPLRVPDVAADKNADRLRQLSEEVSRIASTLARLSSGPSPAPRVIEPAQSVDLPPLSSDTVRLVIRARRLRSRFLPEELFADPAWDMLLDLLQAEISQLRVPVSSLCIAAAVPATTALRWLKALVGQGLFLRRADPHDGRRVFVELAPETSQALRRYFAEVGPIAAI
jgi:DNA-binding MarR family transcriptional regulator